MAKSKPKANENTSETIEKLRQQLDEVSRENTELRRKLGASTRITHGQGKALQAIEEEHGTHQKMHSLLEALRVEKERVAKLKEANRNFDRNSKFQIERNVRLEEELRRIRAGKPDPKTKDD